MQEFKNVEFQRARATIDLDGTTEFTAITTDKQYSRILGLTIIFSQTDCIPGTLFTLKVNGKLLFNIPLEASLFTFSQACPVDDRYFHSIDMEVNQATIEGSVTAGTTLPSAEKCFVDFYFKVV